MTTPTRGAVGPDAPGHAPHRGRAEPAQVCVANPPPAFVEFREEDIAQSVPARFEQQAARYPDRTAVKARDRALTYRALNQAANRMARAIVAARGAATEPVALLVDHPVAAVVGVLGVLKAGKIAVPLDASHPRARISYILRHSQAGVVVADTKNLALVESLRDDPLQAVDIDTIDAGLSPENLGLSISPDAIDWIVYTSASTGHPKGVFRTHRASMHTVMTFTNSACICPTDRLLLLFSHSHNAGLVGLFTALLNGAAVVPFDVKADGLDALADVLLRDEITIYYSVPTVFRAFGESLRETVRFPSLRLIELGGEAVSRYDVELYRTLSSDHCLFRNELGSSEAGFHRWYFINRKTRIDSVLVPAGYAVPGVTTLLLDESGREVEAGEIGEIVVQSRSLACGYWRDPGLTHEVFSPSPDGSGERIFRTGDLGRILPDGRLVYLGRKDSLVKIRGYGVEPAEVEAALREHPQIKDVGVVGRTHPVSGDTRLVAYVVPRRGPVPRTSDLRRFLDSSLPGHMVPSAFVLLEALPLLPGGKVDRRALPEPVWEEGTRKDAFVAPTQTVERRVAEIWEEILGVRPIGLRDNFFELGGDSLRAVRVMAQIEAVCGRWLPLSVLFEDATIEHLARALLVSASVSAIPRRGGTGPCALSFAQQRLWFLDRLEPNSCTYNIAHAVRLRGPLHIGALCDALDTMVVRHEALRTTFVMSGDAPVQVVAERAPVELPVVDLGVVPDAEREAQLERVLRVEARRPFNLAEDVMLRALLVRLGDREHVLLLTMHHIASDGWSMKVLTRDLTAGYEALSQGRVPSLAPLSIQYGDYAVWQREWLQGEELEKQLAYWQGQLAGAPATLQLPTDRVRPVVQMYRGARETAVLSRELTEALHALSRWERVTLYMTLLGAFQTLLHRYAGADDVVVGSAIAGRRRVETDALIGFFVNTLVLRGDLSGDPTFREYLGRVREMVLGAYDHQDLPFEKLVEELRPERSLSWSPLVQVMFVLQDGDQPSLELPGLTVSPVEVETGSAKFDLSASVTEGPQGLHVTLEYNTDLYEPATIRRMLGHYETLLEGIVADPGQRLSKLPLLTEAERQQLLVEWNATQTPFPQLACIHELFEAQVQRTPEAVAVTFETQSLTYRQLNQRANQLAHHLQKRRVGPDVLVGLCLERSLDMVVGLLGILKAGGAYVPLDPADPQERLAFMLEDAHISILVTQQRFLQRLLESAALVVCLDADSTVIAHEEQDNPASHATLDDLCYVMYTSGSTGRPKGVMIIHRGVSNLMSWRQAIFPMDGSDVVLQKTPVTFDLSVDEFFPPLLVGARLVMARPEGHRDCRHLIDTIRAERVSRLGLVPSLMQVMVEEPEFENCTSLRYVNSGGEALPRRVLERFRVRLRKVDLINLYGPTEATVDATFWVAERQATSNVVPIGRPIANTQLYILDAHMQLVPIGVPGELYIGGVGVARGYLGRPELTAERFLPNPFSAEGGARMYKTGDLARYLADGNIEYLGRLDHQVKLRGFRIELGEIEAVLSEHPDVLDSVVVAREDTPGEKRLVAYVVPHQGTAPTIDHLRHFVQTKLPEYMVPSVFVLLTSLPLTSSGKVDRRSLPAPDPTKPDLDYVTPRNAMELQIAQIWEEILGVHPVGVTADFFELGGHSLLAGRLLARVRERFHVDVSLRAFFAAPTVAGVATATVQRLAERAEAGAMTRTLEELRGLSDEAVRRLLGDAGG